MTGIFEIYLKKPKKGEVVILPAKVDPMQKQQKFPNMKDSDKFDYELVDTVELPWEISERLYKWWNKADNCEEFIVRCELPT